MIAFTYTDFPRLPDYLLEDVYSSVNDNILYSDKQFLRYKLLKCSRRINDFVSSIFGKTVHCGIQTILDNQGVHIDYKRTVVYNYIIEPGGESVVTNFYATLDKSKKIESVCIEPFRWHRLRVFLPHEVEGITGKRIAITAWEY